MKDQSAIYWNVAYMEQKYRSTLTMLTHWQNILQFIRVGKKKQDGSRQSSDPKLSKMLESVKKLKESLSLSALFCYVTLQKQYCD